MRHATVALLLLGACTWPTRDQNDVVAGTVSLVNAESSAALVQAGPYVSVIDRISIRVADAAAAIIGSADIPLQRYDSTTTTTIELPEGLATFTAEVRSNNGALLYTGSTTAEVREGFTVEIPVTAVTSVLVIQPDTLKTMGVFQGRFIVYNAGSQPLIWTFASIDQRLCGDGCSVVPQSDTIAPRQFATFTAFIGSSTPASVFSFVVSSKEGNVPVRWWHERVLLTRTP